MKNITEITAKLDNKWDTEIVPLLMDYIKIPNKSVMFDPQWKEHGYMDEAMALIKNWVDNQVVKGMSVELLEEAGRTPLLFIDIEGEKDSDILIYGHMDKQPEMTGWDPDLGPWKPVMKDGKLYGRGGADDGYAAFAAIAAIQVLQQHNIPHPNCKIIIEASEESGSIDLPFYLQKLKNKIGNPKLVIGLDSGAGNYDQMWSTTSLRGTMSGMLSVKVVKDGIHSGFAGGVVPNPFMIMRQLIDRVEDAKTGKVLVPEFHAEIPQQRIDQAKLVAELIGKDIHQAYGFLPNVHTMSEDDIAHLMIKRTWEPTLSVTGISGFEPADVAGNVIIPEVTARLSFRVPPTIDATKLGPIVTKILEDNPPFNAQVTFDCHDMQTGWHAAELAPWLAQLSDDASQNFFGRPAMYMGEGGTIPFMGMLGDMFPQTQFLITGVLGPNSNAHGPNEFIHIPFAKKLTGAVAQVIAGT